MHGSEMYGRELVDLRKESRWEFLNTLFSVSEAVAYMQVGFFSNQNRSYFMVMLNLEMTQFYQYLFILVEACRT